MNKLNYRAEVNVSSCAQSSKNIVFHTNSSLTQTKLTLVPGGAKERVFARDPVYADGYVLKSLHLLKDNSISWVLQIAQKIERAKTGGSPKHKNYRNWGKYS